MRRYIGLALLLVLAACGRAPAGERVQVTIGNGWGQTGYPLAVAWRAGDGDWQRLDPPYAFELPAGETRFGVALRCPTAFAASLVGRGVVAELALEDLAEKNGVRTLPLRCFGFLDADIGLVGVDFDAGALPGAAGVRLVASGPFAKDTTGASGTTPLPVAVGRSDLVLLAYDHPSSRSADHLLGGGALRDYPVAGVHHAVLTLAAGDGVLAGSVADFSAQVPAGFSGSFNVGFLTSGGAQSAPSALGNGPATGGPYRRPAFLSGEDRVILRAKAGLAGREVGWVGGFAPGGGALVPGAFPEPWPAAYAVSPAARPAFSLQAPGAPRLFEVVTVAGSANAWQHFVSPAWLGAASAYTRPDLGGVPGFEVQPLRQGEPVAYRVLAFYGSFGPGGFLAAEPLDGSTSLGLWPVLPPGLGYAAVSGSFVVP